MEHEIIRDHATKRSRGFGFIVFDSEKVVDNLLTNGNMIDMEGTQVSTFVKWFPVQSDVNRYVYTLCTETVRISMSNFPSNLSKLFTLVKYHPELLWLSSLNSCNFNLAEFNTGLLLLL